jgi:hypothetical protein
MVTAISLVLSDSVIYFNLYNLFFLIQLSGLNFGKESSMQKAKTLTNEAGAIKFAILIVYQ